MEHVALGWLVVEMTDSPFMVGVAMAILPMFLFGVFSIFLLIILIEELSCLVTFSGTIPIILGFLLIIDQVNIIILFICFRNSLCFYSYFKANIYL